MPRSNQFEECGWEVVFPHQFVNLPDVVEDPPPEVCVLPAASQVGERTGHQVGEQSICSAPKGGIAGAVPKLTAFQLAVPEASDFRHAASGGHQAGQPEEAIPNALSVIGSSRK